MKGRRPCLRGFRGASFYLVSVASMGIFRAGVRVTRALTPTPSSSSSDDEEHRVSKKYKSRKSSGKGPEVRSLPCATKDSSDLFQVGDSICHLPDELLELSNLGDVLSLQSWNDCLSEKERQHLCTFLPDMDKESFQETLKELLSGQNMYFGNPLEDLWEQIIGGLCNPNVVSSRQTLISLQRREYYHDLRRYHNGMVNSLMEMRELWLNEPEANLEEKLSSWHAWKSSERARMEGLKPLDKIGKVECTSGAAGVVDGGMMRFENMEPDSGDTLQGSPEELALHSDAEVGQVLKRTNAKTKALSVERPHNFVKGDQPESSSISRDEALTKGSRLKRTFTAQVDFGHRSKRNKSNGKEPRALISCDYEAGHSKRAQQNGYRDVGLKASGMVVRQLSIGAHAKVCNKVSDKQVSSSFRQGPKSMKNGDFAFVPPLTPGFSFSTLHFLNAVRASLVDDMTPDGVDCVPFREIVTRVGVCPGDQRILELQMPLDCLVRGALKVLASTAKTLVTNGFKPLVSYDKAMRYWSWVGPVSGHMSTFREVDLQAMSEVWSVPAAILNELLDMFENWLKKTERTLQKLWQLAHVPIPACPVYPDEKERFRELRAQKSSTTVLPSSYELRALFRKEEQLRYSTLEIAFRYTTADGQKSAVAPLRKLGGKSKAKARDHFMLRSDRPSHITILCLVRDAAARLPQHIGTRADVCILLRDSQYIEDVSDLQCSQVVSGALDRLHYERDPCVRYDQDKKLWLYLHGDREEEDFEEGGTTSTRTSRRNKKEGGHSTASPVQANGGDDDLSDPEPESGLLNGNEGGRESESPEFLYDDDHQSRVRRPVFAPGAASVPMRDEVLLPFIDVPASMQPFCGSMQSHPMGWEVYKAGKELSMTH